MVVYYPASQFPFEVALSSVVETEWNVMQITIEVIYNQSHTREVIDPVLNGKVSTGLIPC